MMLIAATPTNRYRLPVTRSTWYIDFATPSRLVLKPPRAEAIVATKNDRPKALVRFRFPALSASTALQEDAYIASETPARTAAPNKWDMLESIAHMANQRLPSIPPPTTSLFRP